MIGWHVFPQVREVIELVGERRAKLGDAAAVLALGAYAAKDRETVPLPTGVTLRNSEGWCALRVKDFSMSNAVSAEGDMVASARTAAIEDFDAAIDRGPDLARHSGRSWNEEWTRMTVTVQS